MTGVRGGAGSSGGGGGGDFQGQGNILCTVRIIIINFCLYYSLVYMKSLCFPTFSKLIEKQIEGNMFKKVIHV